MRRAKFQKTAALVLAVCTLIGSIVLPISASGTGNGSYDSLDYMKELLEAISYESYAEVQKNRDAQPGDETIVINGTDYDRDLTTADVKETVFSDTAVNGENAVYENVSCILTPGTGTVVWKITDVPRRGKYTISVMYYAPANKATSPERLLKINGKVPFAESRGFIFDKKWINEYTDAYAVLSKKVTESDVTEAAKAAGVAVKKVEGEKVYLELPEIITEKVSKFIGEYNVRSFESDSNGNELRPNSKQIPMWNLTTLSDSSGNYLSDFEFVLEKGDNTIELEGTNEDLAIAYIKLSPAVSLPTYAEYSKKYENKPEGKDVIKLEAEMPTATSDKTVYPVTDRSSAANSPISNKFTYLNTIGGSKWANAGQWIEFKFKVENSGLYDIYSRFKQDTVDGMYVCRSIQLFSEGLDENADGYYNGVPFEEAKALKYNYDLEWQVTKATDGGILANGEVNPDGNRDFKFYFEKDVDYTLRFEVTLGSMGKNIRDIKKALTALNNDYLEIIKLTGSTPSSDLDYGFSRIIPDTLQSMWNQAELLEQVADRFEKNSGTKSSKTGTLTVISELLKKMVMEESQLAKKLSTLKDYIGSLGTFLTDVQSQPLQLDYIMIQPSTEKAPKAKTNFFVTFAHEFGGFIMSFFRNYDSMGTEDGNSDETVDVWLAYGRDQSQVIRNLATNEFTPESGINVNLKLVAAGTLLPSILAKSGPDVYLGLAQGDVINYAIRSAVLNIEQYDDFEKTMESFSESARLVLSIDDADGVNHTYGLPEAQGFSMMFVRKDILANLNKKIPETWDDILEMMPDLQGAKMELGLIPDMTIFLYQKQGELFADNGMRINLDSKVALDAEEMLCDFFKTYSLPKDYNAANRFRTGEMPIIIADYSGMYNQLKVFATELEGLWQFYPIPGTRLPDGTVDHSTISTVTAAVMVKGADTRGREKASWEFMKWYTGDECQVNYSDEMVAILGPSAKHNTANKAALESMPWTTEEYKQIAAQFESLAAVPNYPGAYIVSRYTGFAFLAAYNDGADPSKSLLQYVQTINKEITRKRKEFGLETLEMGQTLADLRIDMARDASDLLKTYGSVYDDIVKKVTDYTRLRDITLLNSLVNEINEMLTSRGAKADDFKNIIIPKHPDIKTLSENELLYYISVALSDTAKAVASY